MCNMATTKIQLGYQIPYPSSRAQYIHCNAAGQRQLELAWSKHSYIQFSWCYTGWESSPLRAKRQLGLWLLGPCLHLAELGAKTWVDIRPQGVNVLTSSAVQHTSCVVIHSNTTTSHSSYPSCNYNVLEHQGSRPGFCPEPTCS